MKIRTYKEADWERLQIIHDAARRIELENARVSDAFLSLEDTYENEGLFAYDVLVAEDSEGLVLGFTAITKGEIAWLYVDPAYHRQGVAIRLMEQAMTQAGDEILIEVLEHNDQAIQLYQKMGFRIREKVRGHMMGNETFPVTVFVMAYQK